MENNTNLILVFLKLEGNVFKLVLAESSGRAGEGNFTAAQLRQRLIALGLDASEVTEKLTEARKKPSTWVEFTIPFGLQKNN